MDVELTAAALLSFFLFLVLIAILFRISRQEAAITWMIRAFVGVGAVTAACFVYKWGLTEYLWWASLYGLLTLLFVFGVFGIMEASLTLRILTEIARAPEGITTPLLMKTYNRSLIIRRRITRLVYSEELVRTGRTYILGKTSYFRIRESFLNVFKLAFE